MDGANFPPPKDDEAQPRAGARWETVQHLYTVNAGSAPPANTLLIGELGLELADPVKIWAGVPTSMDATGRKLLYDSSKGAGAAFPEAPLDGLVYGRQGSTASWLGVLPLTGGTLSGPLTIQSTSDATLYVHATGPSWPAVKWNTDLAGTAAGYFESQRYGKSRWSVEFGGTERETGFDAGTNFLINRFDDNGNVKFPTPFAITRATGYVHFGSLVFLATDPNTDLEAATKHYVDLINPAGHYLPLSGGTLNPGPLNIENLIDNPRLNLTGLSGIGSYWPIITLNVQATTGSVGIIQSQRNGARRWAITLGDGFTPEVLGSSAGTDLIVSRYDDFGGLLGNVLTIARGSGNTFINAALTIAGTVILQAGDPTTDQGAATKHYVDIKAGGYLPLTGGRLSGGLSFGTATVAANAPTDMSRHIALFDGWGGFSITPGHLNIVAGGQLALNFDGPSIFVAPNTGLYVNRDPSTDMEVVNLRYLNANTVNIAGGDLRWVNVTGDTMTGNLTVSTPSGATVAVNAAMGTSPGYALLSGGKNRWLIAIDPNQENGTGFGSNLAFYSYHDDGSFSGTPLWIDRQDGYLWVQNTISVGRDPVTSMEVVTLEYARAHYAPITGGGYLPLTAGINYPLTDALYIDSTTTGLSGSIHLKTPGWPAVVWNTTTNITNGDPGNSAAGYFASQRQGLTRWSVEFGGTEQETGGNQGTNFLINRFADNGGVLYPSPFAINRQLGTVTVATTLMLAGPPTTPNQAATMGYVDSKAGNYLPLGGGIMQGGISWADVYGQSPSDATHHLILHSGFGIGVTANRLNYIADINSEHSFIAGSEVAWFNTYGLGMAAGTDIYLARDPTSALQATTKRYADLMLPLAGGVMTGGIRFNDNNYLGVAGRPDLHNHITLFSGYGFSITSGSLNIVTGVQIWFSSSASGLDFAYMDDYGLHMVGARTVNLGRDPTDKLDAVTKQYVDSNVGNYLPIGGGIMRGDLKIANAVNFQMLDTSGTAGFRQIIGGDNHLVTLGTAANGAERVLWAVWMRNDTGALQYYADLQMVVGAHLYLDHDPTTNNEAATKHYVDGIIGASGGPFLPIAAGVGHALTGELYLPHVTPTVDEMATPKFYVDLADQNLQAQISAVVSGNLVFYGQLDVATDVVHYKYTINIPDSPMPPPTSVPKGGYIIVTTGGIPPTGTNIPPLPPGTPQYVRGDWFISDGEIWIFLPTGLVYFTADAVTMNPPLQGQTDVQAMLTWLNTNKLNLAGGTMQGSLYLANEPTTSTQATTKNYVDTKFGSGVTSFNNRTGGVSLFSTDVSAVFGLLTTGGAMVGDLQVVAVPATSLSAVPRSYVDTVNNRFANYLPLAGGHMMGGISFDNASASGSSTTDTSKYLTFWTPGLGIGVSATRLNYNVDSNSSHYFIAAGIDQLWVNVNGIGTRGPIFLGHDPPTTGTEAATKNYVDGRTPIAVDAPNDTWWYGRHAAAWAPVPGLQYIAAGAYDLNTVGPGSYIGLLNITNQTNAPNWPTDLWAQTALVLHGYNSNYGWQNQILMGPAQNTGDAAIWYRNQSGGQWSPWWRIMTAAGGTFAGNVTFHASATFDPQTPGVVPLYIYGNQPNVATGWGGGLGFNYSAGGAEIDFFNFYGISSRSFSWFQVTGTNTATQLMWLSPNGDLSVTGAVYLLKGDPSTSTQAANKNYVDGVITRAGGPFLPLVGGALSGSLSIVMGDPHFILDGGNQQFRYLQSNTNGVPRWQIHLANPDNEAGNNLGSNFVIRRFGDGNGVFLGDPLTINRQTGDATFQGTIFVGTDPTQNLAVATKQYVDAVRTALGGYLPLSGGTLSGLLTAQNGIAVTGGPFTVGWSGAGGAGMVLQAAPGAYRALIWETGGLQLWNIGNSSGEPRDGSNTGGDLAFYRFDDAGNFLGAPLMLMRSSGAVMLDRDPSSNLQAATKQYVDTKTAGNYLPLTGGVLSGRLDISYTASTTSCQLFLGPANFSGNALEGKLRFGGTFGVGVGDTGVRLTSSIRSGFRSNAWGYEYLDVWINNGVPNDGGSDINQVMVASFNRFGITMPASMAITLSADPTANLQAATKQYADGIILRNGGPWLPIAGGEITGNLQVDGVFTIAANASTISGMQGWGGIVGNLTQGQGEMDFVALYTGYGGFSWWQAQPGYVKVQIAQLQPNGTFATWGLGHIYNGVPHGGSAIGFSWYGGWLNAYVDGSLIGFLMTSDTANSLYLALSGGTLTGRLTINTYTPSWGAFNFGQQFVITGVQNNGMGIADSSGGNWFGIHNSSGTLQFNKMPALTDSTTAPNLIMSLAAAGVTVPGLLTVNSTITSAACVIGHGDYTSSALSAASGSGNGWLNIIPNVAGGAYSVLNQAGDVSMLFSNGTPDTGALVIGPWANSASGIRMTVGTIALYGAVSFAGQATFSGVNPQINIDGPNGTWRTLQFYTAGTVRWNIQASADAEPGGGANSGSALRITRFSDAGAVLDAPLTIDRATGLINFTLVGPLHLGNRIAPNNNGWDTSNHITLWDGGYGFSITGGTLNVVSGQTINFWSGQSLLGSWYIGSLQLVTGSTVLLGRDPTAAMEAVTLQYFNAHGAPSGNYLPIDGSVAMTPGNLRLNAGATPPTARTITGQTAGVDEWCIFLGGMNHAPFAITKYIGVASYQPGISIDWTTLNVTLLGNLTVNKTQGTISVNDPGGAYAQLGAYPGGGTLSVYGSNSQITLANAGSGHINSIVGYSGTTYQRWSIAMGNATPESGSNLGSDFSIARFSDTGVQLGTPFAISRQTGNIAIAQTLFVNNGRVVSWGTGNVAHAMWNTTAALGSAMWLGNDGVLWFGIADSTGTPTGGQVSIDRSNNLTANGLYGSYVQSYGSIMCNSGTFYVAANTNYYLSRGTNGTWSFVENNVTNFTIDGSGNAASKGDLQAYANLRCAGAGVYYTNIGVNGFNFRWNGTNILGRVDNAVEFQLSNQSDERRKTDIAPSTFDCLAAVLASPLFQFRWKDATEPAQMFTAAPKADAPLIPIGFVAQRQHAVFPESVFVGGEINESAEGATSVWSMDHNTICAALCGAVQQLVAMNEALAARVATLEARTLH